MDNPLAPAYTPGAGAHRIEKGGYDMTKAKARKRAKSKAGQKVKKREDNATQSGSDARAGKFDPGPNTISSPYANAGPKNFSGARRGAARSR